MKMLSNRRRNAAGPSRGGSGWASALAVPAIALLLLPETAVAVDKAAEKANEAWPITVQARYRLRYNGIEVGKVTINSNTTATSYSISGSSKVSVLFGAFKWSGSSNVSGAIQGGKPMPTVYSLDWSQNKKGGTVSMGFKDGFPTDVAVKPPGKQKPDTVPLTEAHKKGAVDPMSAVMSLTKADGRPPCDRRAAIFDGKRRYDIVFQPKRTTQLPPASGRGPAETGYVCRALYEPVAGHRNNDDTKSYAANRDAEIVLRRIAGSEILIPYSVSIPTSWGTGTMVTERIDIVTAGSGAIAFTD
jgi:hypothetical protein